MGFWFKYVFSLIFYEGIIYDSSSEQVKSGEIDEVLIIGIFIAIICLISSFINKKIIKKYFNKTNETTEKSFFENFYLNNRILILLFFFQVLEVEEKILKGNVFKCCENWKSYEKFNLSPSGLKKNE